MGSERVPEGPKMAPKTLLGPCGPILAYFGGGGQARNFSKSFWAKKGQNFFSNFFWNYFDSQRVWDPQKPKIDPIDPPIGPHFGPICGQKGRFWGQKKHVFLKKNFCSKSFLIGSQMAWDPRKPKIGPLYPPMDPIWAHFGAFWANLGSKNAFFSKKIYSKSFFIGSQTVWEPQKPKIAPLYPRMVPK